MSQHVLLIEDEPNIIEAIRFILSREGWSVDVHSDGRTAMEAIRARAPDVVILDVMLPNKSGYDILSELRDDATHGEIPVLMLPAPAMCWRRSTRPRLIMRVRWASKTASLNLRA